MSASTGIEIERKYDVEADAAVPDLVGATAQVVAVEDEGVRELVTVYLDTADLALARRGVVLRRRSGGPDAGWHVKTSGDGRGRVEHRVPLDDVAAAADAELGAPPAELLDPLRGLVRGRAVEAIATLAVRRHARTLRDADGRALAEVVDDHVTATPRRGEPSAWREWEVELAPGSDDDALLDAVEERLLAAGAVVSGSVAKVARALGATVPASRDGASAALKPKSRLDRFASSTVDALVSRLIALDESVRRGEDDAVHQLRTTARRLRSLLGAVAPAYDAETIDALQDGLRELGRSLGDARDAEVRRERLTAAVADEPEGPAVEHLLRLAADHEETAREAAVAALDGDEYFALLDALEALTPRAGEQHPRAAKALRERMRREHRRVRRAAIRFDEAPGPASSSEALHDARKAAKRLRYVIEAARALPGFGGAGLARRAETVQDALGEHLDAVAAAAAIVEAVPLAQRLEPAGLFSLGRAHAQEERRAADALDAGLLALWELFDREP